MKKTKLNELFQGKVRKNGYHYRLPISIKILRSLNIKENSKYKIFVDAEKNNLIFHFSNKPVGFLQYHLNISNELKSSGDKGIINQIEKNEKWAKENISEESKSYLYSDSINQARLKNLNQEKEFLKKDLIRVEGLIKASEEYEAMKEDHKEIYKKKKLSVP